MPKYKCALCGKEYDSPLERANCEINCNKKAKEDAAKAKRQKLNKEKDARMNEINAYLKQRKELDKLIENKIATFQKDYNQYIIDPAENVFTPHNLIDVIEAVFK